MQTGTAFRNRSDAGRALASLLKDYINRSDLLVLALPRGGVPVGYEVARALYAPLDVFIVRKLGVPGHEELAMGAIASGGITVLNESVIESLGIPRQAIERVIGEEQAELRRREREYRDDRPPPAIQGRHVFLIDDGLATGSTMRAGALAIRRQNPAELIIAVPVAAEETCRAMRQDADRIVCAVTPEPFYSVGLWYEDFSQTTDREVHDLLERAARELPPSDAGDSDDDFADAASRSMRS